MTKRLINLGASVLLALFAAFGSPDSFAASQRIAFVSFHAGDNAPSGAAAGVGFTQAPDVEYTRLLQAAGHTVTRYVTTATPDVNFLNGFDLIIISRSVPSANYQTAESAALWHGITKPTLILGGYILRANRLGFTTGDTMVDIADAVRLGTTQPSHVIFTGVPLDANGVMVNTYSSRVTYNGGLQAGTSINTSEVTAGADVIATIATDTDPAVGGMVIAEYPAGTVMSNATADTLAAKRLVVLTGSREAGITSEASGIWDLSTDGARIFLNAVHYLTGQPVTEPPPQITNVRPASGTRYHLADLGLSFSANSGTAGGIAPENITLTLNGTAVPANQLTITGTAQSRVVNFSGLAPNVQYTAVATVRDSAGREATASFTFDTLDPVAIPAAFAHPVSVASSIAAGLKFRIVQGPDVPIFANTSDRAESQLAGTLIDPLTTEPYPNQATPSTDNSDGSYNVDTINFSVEAGGTERGSFQSPNFPDQPFPGNLGHNFNLAAEAVAYLELAPGRYYMGVNSDDGFVVYTGPNARDLFALDLGRFDGGRGAADSIFQFRVTQAGVYPFRLVYYQGDGGGNLEWFTMNPLTGEKILINDRANSAAVKAYRELTVGERPYVTAVSPTRNAINVAVGSSIVLTINEPGATIQPGTLQVTVNGEAVTPQVTKNGSVSTITWDPAQNLPSDQTIPVTVSFTDSTGGQRTVNFQFKTEFVPVVNENVAKIAWVSFHAADDQPSGGAAGAGFTLAPDIEYTRLLTSAGHTVTRYVTTATPDIDYLHTFDLVIISRSNPSGNFQPAASAELWHSLTNPTIQLGGYALRATRLGYFSGETIPDVSSTLVRLNVKDPAHPIFKGIAVDPNSKNMVNGFATRVTYNGTLQRGISVNNNPVPTGATVLASVGTTGDAAINGTVIAEYPKGTTMRNTPPLPTQGHRLVFLTGSREQGISSEGAGIFDLDSDGAKMFLNAVNYMAGFTEAEPPEITLSAARKAPNEIVISWPAADAAGFVLQASPALVPASWQAAAGAPTTSNGTVSQTVTTSGTAQFFRLARP